MNEWISCVSHQQSLTSNCVSNGYLIRWQSSRLMGSMRHRHKRQTDRFPKRSESFAAAFSTLSLQPIQTTSSYPPPPAPQCAALPPSPLVSVRVPPPLPHCISFGIAAAVLRRRRRHLSATQNMALFIQLQCIKIDSYSWEGNMKNDLDSSRVVVSNLE